MATEDVDPRYMDLDAWPMAAAMDAMWEGQMSAVAAIRNALPALTVAAEAAAGALGSKGRIVYVGAGTSGRVAVQDGAELPPTFDWPQERLVFALAGGEAAFLRSIEGAEDDDADGEAQIERAGVGAADVVIGVAASGTTPFTVAALQRATALGSVSIGIANNGGTPLLGAVRHAILIETGSEVVAGSTRMKAGSAQKIALNLLSTGIMIRLGRVYRGMMVNMHLSNAKLQRRAEGMVARLAGCTPAMADRVLAATGGDIKTAVLLALGVELNTGRATLLQHGGNLRHALAALRYEAKP
jgi:N-acetylmuramic acid 6-phosphate etherase